MGEYVLLLFAHAHLPIHVHPLQGNPGLPVSLMLEYAGAYMLEHECCFAVDRQSVSLTLRGPLATLARILSVTAV